MNFTKKLKVCLTFLILITSSFCFAQNNSTTIKENLDSWIGFTLSDVCDYWSILPDKVLELDSKTKKVEFNYSIQNVEDGAYIPGEAKFGYQVENNEVVLRQTGNKSGTYEKVVVTAACKVVLTLVNNKITSTTYSGDTNALQYFKMEPKKKAALEQEKIEEQKRIAEEKQRKAEEEKKKQAELEEYYKEHPEERSKQKKYREKIFLKLDGAFLIADEEFGGEFNSELLFPNVSLPLYPSLEFYYHGFKKKLLNYDRIALSELGGRFLLTYSLGREIYRLWDFGDTLLDVYLSGGISVGSTKYDEKIIDYEDSKVVIGVPLRIGLRLSLFDLNFTWDLRFKDEPTLKTINLGLIFGL